VTSAAVIVPAWNAARALRRSLPPLLASGLPVLLIDDGSDDGAADLGRALGAAVHRVPRGGPAAARNHGARLTTADILVFVDADVVVHEGALEMLRDAIVGPTVAAFGSYDDRPAASGLGSRWKNLQHHHVHQRAGGEASTFWSGLGAVRRDAFQQVGGFDVGSFPRPSIEDIDLGYRLRARGGRILCRPEARGTHLKRWTVPSVLATDLVRRAIPWARRLAHPQARADLNVSWAERARAVLAVGSALSLPLAVTPAAPITLLTLAAAAAANARLLALYARREGIPFAVASHLLLQAWYLIAIAGWLAGRARPIRPSPAPTP